MTITCSAKRIGRAAAYVLALGYVSGVSFAQSLFDETRSKRQFPPTLTLPETAPAPSPRRAPEAVIEKVTLDAGALFDFDTYELRPEGRVALDEFIGRLKGASVGIIRVVGHADRMEARNQILSEDRAAAVKAYLIGKSVASDRVLAEGRGATQPVTNPGDCTGARSARVIACLQPDRRVGIEVAGTRPSAHSEARQAFDKK